MGAEKAQQLYDFLDKYAQKMQEIEQAQMMKVSSVLSGSLKQLEKTISEQQASIMTVTSFENKRIALQKELGFGEMTFKEILNVCDATFYPKLEDVFVRISASISNIKLYNEKALQISKEKLDLFVDEQQSYAGYTEDFSKKEKSINRSFLQTKI